MDLQERGLYESHKMELFWSTTEPNTDEKRGQCRQNFSTAPNEKPDLVRVVQKEHGTIQWKGHHPVDNAMAPIIFISSFST